MGFEYDDKGILASKGVIDEELLEKLNNLEFYKLEPPKSLGIEWVNQFVSPLFNFTENTIETFLRTYVEHVAQQISIVIQPYKKVLFTGGGAYNDFLINRIRELLKVDTIVVPSREIIDYKEALIFALLGLLKLQGKVNCLSSVTGAKKNHSSGQIFHPNNSD